MLKQLSICVFVTFCLVQHSQGTFYATQLWPTCSRTTALPNFSYAKGVISTVSSTSIPCGTINTGAVITPPLTITWYYYASYPPPACGAPNLPAGDQCCHSTATSTIKFYTTAFVNNAAAGTTVGTSLGNVTAGKFMGQSATWVLTKNTANLNNACNKPWGQEATVAQASITIAGGPQCLNGGQLEEKCPGNRF